MDIAVLLTNLVGLFLLIGVGFVIARTKILPIEATKPLSTLLMKVTVPATVLHSMIRPFDPAFLSLGLHIFLLGAAIFPACAVLALALSKVFRVPEGRRGMWSCCATFCNNGFMGFPVALALFGEEGLTLTVILSIPFNLLFFTIGVKMVCMDRPKDGSVQPISWGKAIFSLVNLAMAVGLVLYFTQIPLPPAILTPISYLSDVTTPLSMLVTGMNLSRGKLGDAVRDRDAFTASLTRLILFPLFTWAVIRLTPRLEPLVIGALLINASMPSPAASSIVGEEYNGCTQLSARVVFLSSLLCIVTIPLISLLL